MASATTGEKDDRDGQKTTYVWRRKRAVKAQSGTRTSKKRKTNNDQDQDQDKEQIDYQLRKTDSNSFPLLLGGKELESNNLARWTKYNDAWATQNQRLTDLLRSTNSHVVEELCGFIKSDWDSDPDAKVPTAVVLPGSNIANHLRLFSHIYTALETEQGIHLVTLTSKDCPNLKVALKTVVAHITEGKRGFQKDIKVEDEDPESELHFDRRLRYDLDILVEWFKIQGKASKIPISGRRIVISIDDTDSFDINILTDLVKMLQIYISQLPIKLILSVSTSLDVFEGKLSRAALRMIQGKAFYAEVTDGLAKILDSTMFKDHSFLLGPKVLKSLRSRQKESLESVDTAVAALKYIFMAHYYSNPFSVIDLQTETDISGIISTPYIQALRMMQSFKRYIQLCAEEGEEAKQHALALMRDDNVLVQKATDSIKQLQRYAKNLFEMTDILVAYKSVSSTRHSRLDIYEDLMSGKVPELKDLSETGSFLIQLETLHLSGNSLAGVLLSEIDDEKKVLSKVKRFVEQNSSFYKTLLFNEIFINDNVSLLESVFSPTYRPAIELALSDPVHYWGAGHGLPHICNLYQMYRESSVYINIYDYWTAFKESVQREGNADIANWDKVSLAWFLHGVSELKLLGILRDCKRKFECVEKIAWKSL